MRLLTVTEVAQIVGLSEWAVRRAIHDGQLPAFKPRGRLRIDEADLELWLDGTRVQAVRARPVSAPVVTPARVSMEGGSVRDRIRARRTA